MPSNARQSNARITVEGYKGEWDLVEGNQIDDNLIARRPGMSVHCDVMTMTPCDCAILPNGQRTHAMHLHLGASERKAR